MDFEEIQRILNGDTISNINSNGAKMQNSNPDPNDDFEAFAQQMLDENKVVKPNTTQSTTSNSEPKSGLDPFSVLENEMLKPKPADEKRDIQKAKIEPSPTVVRRNGPDAFTLLEVESSKPLVRDEKPPAKVTNIPNPVFTPSPLENLEKLHRAEMEKERLIEAEKLRLKDLKDTAELNRVREMIRREEAEKYSIIDEARGWVDETALLMASNIVDNINSVNPRIRSFIATKYNLKPNLLGKLDQPTVSRLFPNPIAKVKLYIELLDNDLPTK